MSSRRNKKNEPSHSVDTNETIRDKITRPKKELCRTGFSYGYNIIILFEKSRRNEKEDIGVDYREKKKLTTIGEGL